MEEFSCFQENLILRIFMALLLSKLSQCDDSQTDVKALLTIKQQLNSGALPDWRGSNPCNWTGIECGGSSNRVVKLSLAKMNLSGTLDPAIGNLSSLQEINFTTNNFSGPIPLELRKCHALRLLDLSWNSFDGNFSGLFDLKNLEVLYLAGNKLSGTISPTVGTLVRLRVLILAQNGDLFGEIPSELGNCSSLRRVDFSDNKLSGPIPPSLFHLKQLNWLFLDRNELHGSLDYMDSTAFALKGLRLYQNNLSGKIPGFLGNLSELTTLEVSSNCFSGPIPGFLGNLSELITLAVAGNCLSGPIPSSLSGLTKLKSFHVSSNNLSGGIPPELGKLSALEQVYMNMNNLSGRIPPELGKLSALKELHMHTNALTGPIPRELFHSRNLFSLVLRRNELGSEIPREIGNLTSLKSLLLNGNNLNGSIPRELVNCSHLQHIDLRSNLITGILPAGLATLRNLSRLYLANNQLTGAIPPQYSSMASLEHIVLSHNYLTGVIPDNFSTECRLLNLELADNQLTGPMPLSLGSLRSLQKLDMSRNQLSGNLSGIAKIHDRRKNSPLQYLQYLLLSDNNFTGELPTDWTPTNHLVKLDMHGNQLSGHIVIGDFFQVQHIDLSSNQFDGPIPSHLGDWPNLAFLNLSFNRLVDEIPADIVTSWQGAANFSVVLDLSNNRLYGQIPQQLNLPHLTLNVSNNNLSGSIPLLLQALNASLFMGNPSLCGPPLASNCILKTSAAVKFIVLGVVLGFWTTCMLALLVCFRRRTKSWLILHCRKGVQVGGIDYSSSPVTIHAAWFGETNANEEANNEPPKLCPTLSDLSIATGGFSSEHIIGDGGFGTVYKGVLSDGTTVAIKKLTEGGCQGEREFVAELETLGNIRHQNLVRLFGYCSNNLERLLVYEYMPNNSLDVWLYSRTEGMEPLPWQMRMVIARDVARGLTFLHHFCIPKIIHRDLKASNILLDANFNARLSDFGLARHLNTYESHISTSVAGSLGYIAPEYAQSWRVTTRGDVFSFGVVLLELLSGKRPAGGAYKPIHGGNLVGWVQHLCLTSQVRALFFDKALGSELGSDIQKELIAALEIALRCTQDDPAKRPPMLEVLRSLEDSLRF